MTIAPYNPGRNITSIVFVDGSLADLQAILSSLAPSVTAIVLDPAQDGIQQMANALAGVSGLEAIHIISHGASGQINLGTTQLTQDTLAQYQTQLATIGNALSDTGDLLLYGCNVAQGNVGHAFVSALANATGADVAASDDSTGSSILGGDWILEATAGDVSTTTIVVDSYAHTLMFGQDVITIGQQHLGQDYFWSYRVNNNDINNKTWVTMTNASLNNASYAGPWDCAEFVTYCVFQAYGLEFGLIDSTEGLSNQESSASAWLTDATTLTSQFTEITNFSSTSNIAGAILIATAGSHVAFSVGNGSVLEANVDVNGSTYYSDGPCQRRFKIDTLLQQTPIQF